MQPGAALSTTAPPASQQPAQQSQALTAAIVLVLASAAPPAVLAAALAGLLAPLGVSALLTGELLELLAGRLPIPSGRSAAAFTAAAEHVYEAAYLLAAARRLAAGGTIEQERIYARQHLAAVRQRAGAAAEVDATAAAHGSMLVWRARDSATDECADADGTVFRADDPPMVGGRRCFPGQAHPNCLCVAEPAGNPQSLVKAGFSGSSYVHAQCAGCAPSD